jgi:ribonucleoside-diphosphate reductase alpha chain
MSNVRFEVPEEALRSAAAVLYGERGLDQLEPDEYDDLKAAIEAAAKAMWAEDEYEGLVGPQRRKLPKERPSLTHKFNIAGHEGYITAGKFPDDSLGEIFLTGVGQEGSTMRGIMDAFAICFSIAIQHGAPLSLLCNKLAHMNFEPRGKTDFKEIPTAQSIPDYIARWTALRFGDQALLEELRLVSQEMSR